MGRGNPALIQFGLTATPKYPAPAAAKQKERAELKPPSKSASLLESCGLPPDAAADRPARQQLANRMVERVVDVVRLLVTQGHIDHRYYRTDTAQLIAEELGHTMRRIAEADIEKGMFDCGARSRSSFAVFVL